MLLPLSGLLPGQSKHSRAVLLIAAGSAGLIYFVAQGLLIGSEGWRIGWPVDLVETAGIRQEGMGAGALTVAVAFLLLLTGGLAQRGFAGGDRFLAGASGLLTAGLLVFVLYPVAVLVWTSVEAHPQAVYSIRLWNLRCLEATGPCGAVWNSLILAVSVGVLTVILGLVLALTVTRTDFDAKRWLLASLGFQSMLPPFLTGLALFLLFSLSGTLNQYISGLLGTQPKDWIMGFPGLLVAQTIAFLPLSFFLIGSQLAAISPAIDRSAQTLGASSIQALRTTALPLVWRTLGVAFLISAGQSLVDLGNPLILAGSFNVLPLEIYRVATGPDGEPGRAAVTAVILLLPVLAAFWAFRPDRTLARIGNGSNRYAFKSSWKLPKGLVWIVCVIAVFWLIFSALIPATLLASGFIDQTGSNAPTVGNYWAAFSLSFSASGLSLSGHAWPLFFTTVLTALVAASVATILGFLIAYLLFSGKFATAKPVIPFLALAFAVPGVILGAAIVYTFNGPPIDLTRTWTIVLVGLVILTLPVAVRGGIAAVSQTASRVTDTFAAMGARSWQSFFQTMFYVSFPAVWVTLIHCIVRAAAALTIVLFLTLPDNGTATTAIISRIESQDYAAAAVYASGLIILLSAISFVPYLIDGKWRRRTVPAPVLT